MPAASCGILYILIIVGREIGLGTNCLGEFWSGDGSDRAGD